MSDHDHEELARRLRETGTVPAPDRLRDDVMDQVRAEPRLRPSRRWFLRPVMPYAAAAATLAVAALAVSQLDLGSGRSSSSGAGGGSAGGAGASVAPERSADGGTLLPGKTARAQTQFNVSTAAAQDLTASPYAQATGRTVVLVVPPSLYADYKARLHMIEQRGGAPTVRVVLRKAG